MAQLLRICIYNSEAQLPLRDVFKDFPGIRIVSLVDQPGEVVEVLGRMDLDVVVVNLNSEDALAVVDQIRQVSPRCGVLGVSRNVEPNAIIRAMRAGCNQYVRWPVDQKDMAEALDQLAVQVAPRVTGSRRICVVGSSGGAGATTVACNLAIELAALTKRECGLIDLNLSLGDVGCQFDVQPLYTVGDLCREGVDIDRTILDKAFHQLACNVSVLARPQQMGDAYEVLPEAVSGMLAMVREVYPFVVVGAGVNMV